jgi:hypothetical protein
LRRWKRLRVAPIFRKECQRQPPHDHQPRQITCYASHNSQHVGGAS